MMNDIDARSGLTQALILDFAKSILTDETINIFKNDDQIKVSSKLNLVNDLLLSYDDFKDEDIFKLIADNVSIIFDGNNLSWWKKTSKRIEKFQSVMYSTKIEKKEKKTKQIEDERTYSVAVAYGIENCLSSIEYFEGPKSEAIEFINSNMLKKYFATSTTTKVVINLAFDKEEYKTIFSSNDEEAKERYKHDFTMWYTLEELADIGAINTK